MIKYEMICQFSSLHPDKIALYDDKGAISWSKFRKYVLQLIHAIERNKIDYTKPILYLSENSKDIVLLGAAFSTLGVAFQGLDYHLDKGSIALLIQQLDVKHIFVSSKFLEKFVSLSAQCQVHHIEQFTKEAEYIDSEPLNTIEKTPTLPFRSYSFTSGTTGIPKIVYRTTSFDKRRFEYLQNRYQFNTHDVHFTCLPLYHVSASGWLRLFLSLGCTCIVHNFDNSYKLCEIFHVKKISTALLSPHLVKQIMDQLTEGDALTYFPSLRFVITGGKNFPATFKKKAIRALGPVVYEYYGTTETGINTLLDPKEAFKYPGSVGREFEGNHIEILDKHNSPLPSGQTGRIAIHSYMNMDQYLHHISNFVMLDEKKYLITSDYGYKNAEGYLFIAKRATHIENNIRNLYAMENEVVNLDYVADVAVYGKMNSDRVDINVVLNKYYPYRNLQADIKNISENYEISDISVHIVSMLDYTLTGKIKLPLTVMTE